MAAGVAGSGLLVGPPELCNYIPLADRSSQDDATTLPANRMSQDTTRPTTGDDFLDMLRNGMQELQFENAEDFLHIGQTENVSPTFLTSDRQLLDFCFHAVPETLSHRLTQLPQAAWDSDALTAFKRYLKRCFQVLKRILEAASPTLKRYFELLAGKAHMTLTENCSPTYSTSSNSLLDFFFHVVPDTPSHRVTELLEAAWNEDPLTALKLVCQLRGVRGTGKSDRDGFYASACWIHSRHPKTLVANVDSIAQFGYFKDLPEILVRLLQGSEATEKRKSEKIRHKLKIWSAKAKAKSKSKHRQMRFRRNGGPPGYFARKGAAAREAKMLGTLRPREERIAEDLSNGKIQRERARVIRKEKRLQIANLALKRYLEDSRYRALHDQIAQFFATLLSKDLEALKTGKVKSISLAAKWCPSLDSSYDRSTLLCENIARRLFPREDFNTDEDRHYVYRARERLRKEALVPLRKALQLPELYMSSNLWGELPYERVASVAMKNYKDIFLKHDATRFTRYLEDVEAGKKKIAAGALLPHEVIQQALRSKDSAPALVAELQWKRMVEDMKKEGKLSNTLAVCDVSGSMEGTPMEVCIALGMLVSEISEEPWKGHVMTFSESPELHLVTGDSLVEKYAFTKNMNWGTNTDFQKIFDVILNMTMKCRLEPEKMIKQLLVISDMEFDKASANPWKTDYMVIKDKFRDAGYGLPPTIVFWNLRNSGSTPVLKEEEGVAMVSGFSENHLKLFVENDGEINPMIAMKRTIEGKLFERLRIVD